jgi:hypothetical protein
MDPPFVAEKRPESVREAFAALGVKPEKQPLGKGRPRFTDPIIRPWFKDVNDLYKKVQQTYSKNDSSMRSGTYFDLDILLGKHGPLIWGLDYTPSQSHGNVLPIGESDCYRNELRFPRDKDKLTRYSARVFSLLTHLKDHRQTPGSLQYTHEETVGGCQVDESESSKEKRPG